LSRRGIAVNWETIPEAGIMPAAEKKKQVYNVGLLGFGVVGAGVVDALQRRGELIENRTGLRLRLHRIADIDLERDRGVRVDRKLLTTDAQAVVDDSDVDIVVELIGGTTAARELVLRALRRGKPVVTANKALLAEHAEEIFTAAGESGADLYYEASVGGGIPVIRALREGLVANHIEAIYGIVNGTCNYILTEMERTGRSFEEVLRDAQAAGYAEADPSLDVDGIDTAHKAVILASLAYGFPIPYTAVEVEGIRRVSVLDIQYARELGYRIKLLAVIRHEAGAVLVGVYPALVSCGHMLASVGGVFNAVLIRGDVVGDTLYYGRGAGRLPTASAVLSDLADVARNLHFGSAGRVPALRQYGAYGRLRPLAESEARFYLRLSLPDRAGMLAQVARILGDHGISIASVVQKEERSGQHVPVIIITHRTREADMRQALQEIDRLSIVGAPTVRLRIVDFD